MVTRVSTVGNYATVLANLMAAQQRQLDAGERVSTQRNGHDLKGFAGAAELLTGMRSVQTRLKGFQDQNQLLADKLTTQDTALNQVAGAALAARQAIADALASGDASTLMSELQGAMNKTVGALNTRYNGTYLFAGGAINTQPVTAQQLSDLTTGPPIASFFQNDQYKAKNQVDDSTKLTTGVLADAVGAPALNAFQAMQAFETGGSGPFGGNLTAAQRAFLENQLATWDQVHTGVINVAAQNGMAQQRLEGVGKDLVSRQNTLAEMMGNITDADMGKASADLQMAALSIQAAAQVFQTLKESSLLNLLRIG